MPPYESWVERQIREAVERGEFDNLPGAGKPLRDLDDRDENWWIKRKLEREGLRVPLPTSLALRREVAEIADTVAGLRGEQQVRDVAEDLNDRVRDAQRRRVDGPAVVLRTVDIERVVRDWRTQRGYGPVEPEGPRT